MIYFFTGQGMLVAQGVGGMYIFGGPSVDAGGPLSPMQQFVYFYVNRAIVRK